MIYTMYDILQRNMLATFWPNKKNQLQSACLTNPFASTKDHGPTSRRHIAGCSGRKASLETTRLHQVTLKKDYTQIENTSQPRIVSKYWILNIEPSVSMSVELRVYKIRVLDQQNQEYVILSLSLSCKWKNGNI